MGKAAANERIKLHATYLNNIAVGVILTGFIVPYVAFFLKIPEGAQFFMDWQQGKARPTYAETARVVLLFILIFVAMNISFYLHRRAKGLLSKIQD